MAKRFVNAPENVVPDLMQGVALDTSRVTLVDPQCGHSIAVRTSLLEQGHPRRVAVVSGGGSGHEPMAAGYVGDGMLAGAVAGSVFASPTVPAIRALLNTVAPLSSGIVVVVMNYTGDRHLFGAAVHNLRITHPNCECAIVVVGDDVALPDASHPRGIAGTIFVLKVACAAADRGLPFEQVVQIAKTASKHIVSYGVALEPCTLPGHPVNTERLGPNECECSVSFLIYASPISSNHSSWMRLRCPETETYSFTTRYSALKMSVAWASMARAVWKNSFFQKTLCRASRMIL